MAWARRRRAPAASVDAALLECGQANSRLEHRWTGADRATDIAFIVMDLGRHGQAGLIEARGTISASHGNRIVTLTAAHRIAAGFAIRRLACRGV